MTQNNEAEIKKDFRILVVFNSGGEGYILEQSPDCLSCDLIEELFAEDNNMRFWDRLGGEIKPSNAAMIFKVKPWSHLDTMIGEYDIGFDCYLHKVLWQGDAVGSMLFGENND